MLKRFIVVFFSLLALTIMSSAQENSDWSAYLFDNINYDLIRINPDGSAENFPMGLEGDQWISSQDISINSDGTLLAYCKKTPENTALSATLIIREIETGINRHEIEFGTTPACSVTAFSADDSQIAVSFAHVNAFEAVPAGESRWSLQTFSVETGEMIHILQETDEFMPDFTTFGEDIPMIALVRQFDANIIRFAAVPFVGMGGPASLPVYDWNIAEKTVTELSGDFGRVNNDTLEATGEMVFPALDESLTAAQPEGPLPQANVLNIMDADGTVSTIYQNEEWVIVSATFINDGASVAVLLLPGFEIGQAAENPNALRVDILNRDGTVQTLDQRFDGGTGIDSVPGGAIIPYTPNPTTEGLAATQFLVWDGSTLNSIGEYLPDYSKGWSPPQLLWVSPMTVSSDLDPFPTI